MIRWDALRRALAERNLLVSPQVPPRAVGGGDISAAWCVTTDSGAVFLKTGSAEDEGMLACEAEGLAALAATGTLRVPRVLGQGCDAGTAWLALEWLALRRGDASTERALGTGLAAMHRHTADRYGWPRDNWIGRTPQRNAWCNDWAAFYADRRLGFQLELAARNGFGGALQACGRQLRDRLPEFFDGYQPEPSLLHGDLWGGNWAACDGAPVLFDPAAHYGDRESDLAMTRVFGGFGPAFYEAYEAAWPLAPGHAARDPLYRLYHLLNHLNLFGGGYLGSCMTLLRTLEPLP